MEAEDLQTVKILIVGAGHVGAQKQSRPRRYLRISPLFTRLLHVKVSLVTPKSAAYCQAYQESKILLQEHTRTAVCVTQ
jgi:hypothetical protein